ncbi:hypothetical protein MAPG_05371 [Magnaporthiopsis poae ATCC 64411]|uniref:Uncharacterized protein n=1 Tax=Magnaporthiopsis poae (strain ATCC 64411 / 73-15) TaxID=644358 RepID=A0A0C4DZ79_MAGP6|nr:hypothetical protein MAPG_05371 [Magnaporthiopsis poae ATCC 64411]
MVLRCVKTNLGPAPLLVEKTCAAIMPRSRHEKQTSTNADTHRHGRSEGRSPLPSSGNFWSRITVQFTYVQMYREVHARPFSLPPDLIFQKQKNTCGNICQSRLQVTRRQPAARVTGICQQFRGQHPRQRGGVCMAMGRTKLVCGRQVVGWVNHSPNGYQNPHGASMEPITWIVWRRANTASHTKGNACACARTVAHVGGDFESLARQSAVGAGHDWGLFCLCCLTI